MLKINWIYGLIRALWLVYSKYGVGSEWDIIYLIEKFENFLLKYIGSLKLSQILEDLMISELTRMYKQAINLNIKIWLLIKYLITNLCLIAYLF